MIGLLLSSFNYAESITVDFDVFMHTNEISEYDETYDQQRYSEMVDAIDSFLPVNIQANTLQTSTLNGAG